MLCEFKFDATKQINENNNNWERRGKKKKMVGSASQSPNCDLTVHFMYFQNKRHNNNNHTNDIHNRFHSVQIFRAVHFGWCRYQSTLFHF